MEKQKKTEEELKDKIYDTYTKYHEAPSSDRRQVYLGQLWDLASRWCRNHLFSKETQLFPKETGLENFFNEMGEEIFKALKRLINKNIMPKEELLENLGGALYYAKYQFYRNEVKGPLKIPRSVKIEKRKISELKEMWRSEIGRELKDDEFVYRYSIWKQISEEEARAAYLESIGKKFISNTFSYEEKEKEYNTVEEMEVRSITMEGTISVPHDEVEKSEDAEIIKNALETVLNEYSDKMKPFYRALFTVRCIKKNKNYQRFLPIFNGEILEMFKQNGKKPAQYEIYMKYHPNAEKSTAEANASQMSRKFFADLNKAIKEKDPEINF